MRSRHAGLPLPVPRLPLLLRPLLYLSVCSVLPATLLAQSTSFAAAELASLDLEQLMDIRITSVSRRDESLAQAPASAFVITADDIHRSGATSLPEILRMAPNLQVARINSYEYAITSRGFNNEIGNKLLVLLDGRTIYTPMFSGVFWEMQDTNLDDIERIEVISGPGGTIWGANAVNGVINIITKNSADTQATLVSGGAGSFERHASVRTGGGSGPNLDWRVYGKANEWDNTWSSLRGADGYDEWLRKQLGFRVDWDGDGQSLVVQGDTMQGESQRRAIGTYQLPPVEVKSSNLQARWTRELDGGSSLSLQGYVVHSEREEAVIFSPTSTIVDLEAQHHFTFSTAAFSHDVVWGGGHRRADDTVGRGLVSVYLPASRHLAWENLFVQDKINISPAVSITPGIKLEWNDYTGMEQLPSVRFAWQVAEHHNLWAGWSRAVRAPSRFDRDVFFPDTAPYVVAGGPDFVSEVAHVAEVGYRSQPAENLSYSLTLYHYAWDKLRSGTPPPLPIYLVNNIAGESWGVEGWGTWQVASGWRLRAGFNTLDKDLGFRHGTTDTVGIANSTLHNDPDYQLTLRSSHDLSAALKMDVMLRKVAALEIEPVPAYSELDLRLGWNPSANFELSLTGTSLLNQRHPEYGPAANRSEFSRSVLLGFRWTL